MKPKFGIYDLVTDEILLNNLGWDSIDRESYAYYNTPKLFKNRAEAEAEIKILTKDFLDTDPTSEINFVIIQLTEHKWYKIRNEDEIIERARIRELEWRKDS